MRVLLLPSAFPPALGGIETAAEQLAWGLRRLGHEVSVLTNSGSGAETGSGEVTYHDFAAPHRSVASLARYTGQVLSPRALARALPYRPDVTLVMGISAQAQVALWLKGRHKVPMVVATHGEVLYDRHSSFDRNPWFKALLYGVNRAASVWVFPSRFLERAMSERVGLRAPVRLIPNGVDSDVWRPLPAAPVGPPRIGAWGRLSPEKGFDRLCAAWVDGAPAGATLWIAGAGDEAEALSLHAGNGVELVGRLSPNEIMRLLVDTHLVAVPSRHEAFGLSAAEAAMCGRTVLHDGETAIGDVVGRRGEVVDFRPGHFWPRVSHLLAEGGRVAAAEPPAIPSWSEVAASYAEVLLEVVGVPS